MKEQIGFLTGLSIALALQIVSDRLASIPIPPTVTASPVITQHQPTTATPPSLNETAPPNGSPNPANTPEMPDGEISSPETLPDCVQQDCNCSDFRTQTEAQQVLDAFPEDPHRLDANGDKVACESLAKS